MSVPPRRLRRVRPWPRGVRGRLVATYLLVAVFLGGIGAAVLTTTLASGLRANIDVGLRARADALTADVVAGNIERTGSRASTTRRAVDDLSSFSAVLDPRGTLVESTPVRLPAPLPSVRTADTSIRTVGYDGTSFRVLTMPVRRSDGTWRLVVGQSLEAADEAAAEVRRALLIAAPIVLVLVGAGAWLLSGSALKPVDRMRAEARRLGDPASGDGRGRLTEPATGDSLARLARTFNELLDRLHQSLEQQRGLVADAGHELRTPLAVLHTELETAVRPHRTRDDLIDSIEHARLEVERLSALSEDLLLLAQTDSPRSLVARDIVELAPLVDASVAGFATSAASRSVEVGSDCAAELAAWIDPAAVRRVLDNLISNAIRHAPDHGHVRVDASSSTADELVLRVRDDGPGFPADFVPHAFDRFSRSESHRSRADPSGGTGLGLAVVHALVIAHGGSVVAANHHDGGAEVTVRIPRWDG